MDQRNPVCPSLWGLLLFFFVWTSGYVAPVTTSTNPTSTWTFSKNQSYLAFSPNLTSVKDQQIILSFRTRSPNGLLFCHLLEQFNQSFHPLLESYHFCAELSHGYLHVKYNLNQNSDVIKLGRALNDDSWHTVDIFLNTTTGELQVSLDNLLRTSRYLRAYTQSLDIKSILDWKRLKSVVSYAGLSPSVSMEYHQFIGCLQSLKYRELIEVTWEVSPSIIMQAESGCQDLCREENPCGEGRCINLYTSVQCDCFSLDREGEKCQDTTVTEITLHGYEWLTYQLYTENQRTLRDSNRFSLQFKSDRGSGVLLYAVGSTDMGDTRMKQHHSHVIASVHQGTVKASVAFGDDILEQTMGLGVDDNRWHNLTIVHEKVKVEFYLDGTLYVHETVNDMYYLGLDPYIYIGGGESFVQTLGLQVRQNFAGCLKNIFVNEHSILYELRSNYSTSQLHPSNTEIQYGCHKVDNIPLTFPRSRSILFLSGYYGNTFSIQLDFRTVRETAILLSADIQTINSFGYPDKGYFEVWINGSLPMMKFVRSMYQNTIANTTLLPVNVSNNKWHSLSFNLKQGQVKISVDNLSLPSMFIGNDSQIYKNVEIGYGHRMFEDFVGFVGCIRNIVIQGQFLDPISLMESAPPGGYHVGLKLDGCHLVDHCRTHQHCRNGGRCLSDWDGVTCDCSSSAYQGKYCQFARYRSSCDSYYQSGWRSSGVYVIDVDGSGPVEPTYVTCQMGIRTDGDYYGQTLIAHNLSNQTKVRGTTLPDLMMRLTYREMGFVELQKLTQMSAWCEQYVQYTCLNAPLRLGNLTSFKSVDGTVVQYIGDVDQTLSSGCNKRACNCDREDMVAREDSGYNRITSQLPIKEITVYQFTDFKTPDSKGFLTIGPLKCWGNKESVSWSAVTFVTEGSFLQLPGWVYGDMAFSFRTHQTSAVLMYQSSSNGDWFKVTLVYEDSIRIEIQIKENLILSETLDADKPLNDGAWHRVTLELSSHEVRCGLDSMRKIVSIPFHSNITFDNYLYLGGKMYDGSYDNLPGLIGCVKGLVYNGRPRNLINDVYDDMPGIQSGCRPRCSPDPCQNGAQCVEMWNSYQCICTNEWAHSGHSCEININENVVTITGDQSAFFDLRVSSNPLEMENRIIFSFHTQLREALVFYMYDELNNFIQLEVVEGRKLRFSRNNFQQIFYTDIDVPGITEPTWKQVVLDPSKINVNGKITYLNRANNKLESGYSSDPFAGEMETVKPPRPKEKQPPFLRLYLGGTPANVTELDKFQGCFRGLKIGDRLIDLQKNSEGNTGLKKGCEAGCTKNWCLNGGYCIERWGDGDFECDCSRSKFAGDRCQLEASGIFSGQSVVHYHFTPSGQAARTNTEQFSFIFKTNCTEDKTMVLLLILSRESKDYIVISLSNRFVRALLKQGNNLFEEKLKGSFCDGTAHKFEYKRESEEMWIRVDRSPWRKKFTTSTQLEGIDTLLVGGLIPGLTDVMEPKYGNPNLTVNFTGCLSDVNYKPVRGGSFEVQPMKQLRDLKNGSMSVYGPEVPQCSPVDYDDHHVSTTSTVYVPTTTANPLSGVTMPPWDVGAPKIYIIGIGNNGTTPPPPTTTTSTTTTAAIVTTAVDLLTTEEGPTNITLLMGQITTDKVSSMTILIVSTLLALLCLIAILIAVVMRRMRTRYVTYDVRKKYNFDDFELKEPLNHNMETYSPAPPPPKKDIHIATWDEFSMVSATLGSSKKKQNGILPGKVNTLPADVRNLEYPVQTTFLPDDNTKYPVYSCKKNRPASSISEVLEEMERQQRAKELGADPDQYEEPKSHGEGDLEWDPLVDHTPLTMTQDEDSDGKSRATSCESEDPLKILEQQQDLLHEYNADSGYEAESQRNGDEDLDLNESITPPTPDSSKLYYDITGVEGSPQCTSTPHKIIVESEEQFV